MNKNFIRDDNIVRQCSKNVSKMNVFEYMYYSLFHWKLLQRILGDIGENVVEGFGYLVAILMRLLELILLPIFLIMGAIVQIRKAKKECAYYDERRNRE